MIHGQLTAGLPMEKKMRLARTLLFPLSFLILTALLHPGAAAAADHRLGLGIHYWKTVDDIVDDRFDDLEDDGFAWILSYRWDPAGLINFQFDVEYYGDGYGGSAESAFSPIVYALVGDKLYGGIGVGVIFSDGLEDDVSDPFFAARVGYEFTLLPGIRLDLNANYRAGAFDELDQASTDAITLGALVRFNL